MALAVAIYFDGGRMNFLHHLTLMSAVRRGHDVTLYIRGDAQNIPEAVRAEDVGKIVDANRLHALPGGRLRSTVFQYEALAALDETITLSFDHFIHGDTELMPENGSLFGWQSEDLIGTGILALPPNSPALSMILEVVRGVPPANAGLGGWGSQLLTRALEASGEIRTALPKSAFYLLDPHQVGIMLKRDKGLGKALGSRTCALPVYHECLLPDMRDDFYGLPRYWSTLGSAIRENAVTVRNALAYDHLSPPERIWNDEPRPFQCFDWSAQSSGNLATSRQPSGTQTIVTTPAAKPEPTASAPSADTGPLKVMIVTTMRNEAPFILEWVAYHRSIGVTDFVVYTNDCDDGTVEMLDALAERGLITARIDNPFRSSAAGDWQRAALWDLQESDLTNDVDWLIPMDVDEFINIHTGDGRFADLVRAVPDADMISMIWRLFGNNFIDTYEDRFVTEQFDRATDPKCSRPALAWGFKTAFKPRVVGGTWSVHRPKKIEDNMDELKWYLGSGKRADEKLFKTGWRAKRRSAGYDLVTLNHYSLRSSESYLVKKHRGRVNHTKEDQDIGYFFRMNHNVEQERSIQSKLPAATALFQSFLQDETIRSLHEHGVASHRNRIQNLKENPDYRNLFDKITSELLRVYSRLTPHFGNWIFAVGPKAIPQEYENWARAQFDRDSFQGHLGDPPGLQPSGTILPRPEFLDQVNERRRDDRPEAKPLDFEIYGVPPANKSHQPS